MSSLYVHIPFCLKRCIYCDFVSGIYDPEKADKYIFALKKEILSIPHGTSLSTLFIGGGTPTALSADALRDLITYIFDHLSFADNYEATIEANPGTLDKEKLRAIREAGMNRISIGIQSFNDDELMLLGRLHSSSLAERAVQLARDAGFENIGIDLIYGIPGQSMKSWDKTLEKAVKLKPKHISAYELTVEEGTELHELLKNPPLSPFYKGGIIKSPIVKEDIGGECSPLWQRGVRGDFFVKTCLPEEDRIIEMYNHTIDYLASEGYGHYEISNFSMPGYPCRHNLNYWDRGEYHGVGLGAHSFISGNRSYNTCDLEDYLKADNSPLKETEHITEDKAISEALFLGLRKIEGINVESFFRRYGLNILSHFQDEIADMQEKGLIEITNLPTGQAGPECSYETGLRLTRRGFLLSNEVFVKFI